MKVSLIEHALIFPSLVLGKKLTIERNQTLNFELEIKEQRKCDVIIGSRRITNDEIEG